MFDSTKRLYLVLEYLSGGEVFERVVEQQRYSEAQAAEVVQQVAGALKYLHSMGIVHRDIKVLAADCHCPCVTSL